MWSYVACNTAALYSKEQIGKFRSLYSYGGEECFNKPFPFYSPSEFHIQLSCWHPECDGDLCEMVLLKMGIGTVVSVCLFSFFSDSLYCCILTFPSTFWCPILSHGFSFSEWSHAQLLRFFMSLPQFCPKQRSC